MTVKPPLPSHTVLIPLGHAERSTDPRERKWFTSVFTRHLQSACRMLLAAALVLPAMPVSADNGNDPPTAASRRPSSKVRGLYIVRIAGYYSGSGEARASSTGIKISARLKDPRGKEHNFQARNLEIEDDRFTGTGTLGTMEVKIDGRLDAQDRRGNGVLKKGRLTFTFSANGHHSRGAGDQREPGGN